MSDKSELIRAVEIARKLKQLVPWQPQDGPQRMAYESNADIIGYGGAAGGGKTDLMCGIALTKHKRAAIFRRESAQLNGITQRIEQIIGNRDGYNSQSNIWRANVGSKPLIEFGGLKDTDSREAWRGRAHSFKGFDEATNIRQSDIEFVSGWARTDDDSQRVQILITFNPPTDVGGRWVIDYFAPWLLKTHPNPAKCGEIRWFSTVGENKNYELPDSRSFVYESGEIVYDYPPDTAPERIITPKSRTFIKAKVSDNKYYLDSGYIATLQAMPEPLRSQMLHGDFSAGVRDSDWQVIPTAWVEAAQARWSMPHRLGEMTSLGVDVARGGSDDTVIARRHGTWFDKPLVYKGFDTPSGSMTAGLVVSSRRDDAPIHIDVIGVGAAPYDFLVDINAQVIGVNVANSPTRRAQQGGLEFYNMRAQLWWLMREALDPDANTGIALPPDPRLLSELCAPCWSLRGGKIQVESREEIKKRTGKSPDVATAYILALIDTVKMSTKAIQSAPPSRPNIYR